MAIIAMINVITRTFFQYKGTRKIRRRRPITGRTLGNTR